MPRQPGVQAGQVEKHRFKSAKLKNEREVAVYLPSRYSSRAEPYPLLVVCDEDPYMTLIPTPTILDNLISEFCVSAQPASSAIPYSNEPAPRLPPPREGHGHLVRLTLRFNGGA